MNILDFHAGPCWFFAAHLGNDHLLCLQMTASRACSHRQSGYGIAHRSDMVLQVLLERASGATKDAEAKQQNIQVNHAYMHLFVAVLPVVLA